MIDKIIKKVLPFFFLSISLFAPLVSFLLHISILIITVIIFKNVEQKTTLYKIAFWIMFSVSIIIFIGFLLTEVLGDKTRI
jgi:ABC-type Na+ efflux pump permease subunit